MHFLGREIGRGIFFRGDFGFAGSLWNPSGSGVFVSARDSIGSSEVVMIGGVAEGTQSDTGIGFLLGGGFAFPLKSTNILFNLNYAQRRLKGENHGTISVSLGAFFD
jgi:hypothetical protein